MPTETFTLPVFDITLNLVHDDEGTSGSISAPDLYGESPDEAFDAAIDAITSFILAAACAGIDVRSAAFLEAIETTVQTIWDRFD